MCMSHLSADAKCVRNQIELNQKKEKEEGLKKRVLVYSNAGIHFPFYI